MTAWLLIAPGALVALGVCLVVAGFRPRHARLADALGVLADDVPAPTAAPESEAAGLDRLGAWWVRSRYVVAQGELQRNLRLRGRTLATHYTHKLLAALAGLVGGSGAQALARRLGTTTASVRQRLEALCERGQLVKCGARYRLAKARGDDR